MRLEILEERGGVESLAAFKFEQPGHFTVSRLKSLPASRAGELDSGFRVREDYLGGWFQGLTFLIVSHMNSLCSHHTELTATLVHSPAHCRLLSPPRIPFPPIFAQQTFRGGMKVPVTPEAFPDHLDTALLHGPTPGHS